MPEPPPPRGPNTIADHTGLTFKQAVGIRRSTRFFHPYRPVEKAKVQKILEAARLQSQHGTASLIRKAVIVYRDETDPETFQCLCEAMYSQAAAAQAPCHIYWTIDMSGWDVLEDDLSPSLDVGTLTPGHRTFAEWLSAIETGMAMGSALLAAGDEGLGTALLTGQRARIGELLGMPENTTVAQIQLVGYPAEGGEAGGQRPRPDFEALYFEGRWGNPLRRDPTVVEELIEAGMLQAPAPPHRRQEIRPMAGVFGLLE